MKFLNIIFSIYFIALAMMPCTDLSAAEHEKNADMEVSHSEKDHDDCEDTCPPFCSCACCGISIGFFCFTPITIEPAISYKRESISFIQESFSNFYHTIWLPPKISHS